MGLREQIKDRNLKAFLSLSSSSNCKKTLGKEVNYQIYTI